MKAFLTRHAANITGVLSGFDRLIFRGYLQRLVSAGGFFSYLNLSGIALSDFKEYVQRTTDQVKQASLHRATELGRPILNIRSSAIKKHKVARKALAESPVESGLICVLRALEPCMTYELRTSRATGRQWIAPKQGKCSHLYHYLLDPEFGFMSARIQTWFPFTIQIWVNGREWLAHQLEQRGERFVRLENCFLELEDVERAQELFDQMLAISWPQALGRIVRSVHPAHEEIFQHLPMEYYWSVFQSEWATDVMFKDQASVSALYPSLVHHAIAHLRATDVIRYMGRKLHGDSPRRILSEFKDRPEGVRIKHWVDSNSQKMYNRPRILRVEATINQPKGFKVYRPKTGGDPDDLAWREMRKGVADLHRRAQVSQSANERYIEAMAAVDSDTPLAELVGTVTRRAKLGGERFRALHPWGIEDAALLEAIGRGEFTINGFRNRDLAAILFPNTGASQLERRRRSARVTRKLRLLRAHGLIKKVPRSHRYQLTTKGRRITTAVLAARRASVERLVADAA